MSLSPGKKRLIFFLQIFFCVNINSLKKRKKCRPLLSASTISGIFTQEYFCSASQCVQPKEISKEIISSHLILNTNIFWVSSCKTSFQCAAAHSSRHSSWPTRSLGASLYYAIQGACKQYWLLTVWGKPCSSSHGQQEYADVGGNT